MNRNGQESSRPGTLPIQKKPRDQAPPIEELKRRFKKQNYEIIKFGTFCLFLFSKCQAHMKYSFLRTNALYAAQLRGIETQRVELLDTISTLRQEINSLNLEQQKADVHDSENLHLLAQIALNTSRALLDTLAANVTLVDNTLLPLARLVASNIRAQDERKGNPELVVKNKIGAAISQRSLKENHPEDKTVPGGARKREGSRPSTENLVRLSPIPERGEYDESMGGNEPQNDCSAQGQTRLMPPDQADPSHPRKRIKASGSSLDEVYSHTAQMAELSNMQTSRNILSIPTCASSKEPIGLSETFINTGPALLHRETCCSPPRESSTKTATPRKTAPLESRSRRRTSKLTSYALPSLREKLRREDSNRDSLRKSRASKTHRSTTPMKPRPVNLQISPTQHTAENANTHSLPTPPKVVESTWEVSALQPVDEGQGCD
ncbi:hypothetical protein DFS34DRAFT_209986 [Phlyctochytrium arcticum]|nr:hypothetical protein DFS34DRAFT_209986 [Phlyctochytrium arcticum]